MNLNENMHERKWYMYTYKREAFFLVAAYFSFTNTINLGNIFGCLCITAIFFFHQHRSLSCYPLLQAMSIFYLFLLRTLRNTSFSKSKQSRLFYMLRSVCYFRNKKNIFLPIYKLIHGHIRAFSHFICLSLSLVLYLVDFLPVVNVDFCLLWIQTAVNTLRVSS